MFAVIYCMVAFATLAVLWFVMVGWNVNLLVSAAIASSLLAFGSGKLVRGAWSGFCQVVMRSPWPRRMFWFTFATAYLVASLISGDWMTKHRLLPTCIVTTSGDLHLHHWLKGLAALAWHGDILRILRHPITQTRTRAVALYGRRTLRLAVVLLVITLICIQMNIGTYSLKLDALIYVTGFAMLGVACLKSPYAGPGLRIALAFSTATALAIAASGIPEFFRDIIKAQGIPSMLIFWHTDGDPMCH